jgi:hypothetical protein
MPIAISTSMLRPTRPIAHHDRDARRTVSPPRAAASRSVSTRVGGAKADSSSTGNVDVGVSVTLALSVTGITARTAFIAALAIVALLLTGWRKPARAEPRSPRGIMERGLVYRTGPVPGVAVDHLDAPEYHRPGPLRRLLAAIASGGIALLFGVLTAIVLSFAVAMAVIWLTNLLEQ